MQVTARTEYALRAMAELAAQPDRPFSRNDLADAQELPGKFLESILRDLVREGLLVSRRGTGGGFQLAKPPAEISLAAVVRAVDGPLAAVRGIAPEGAVYPGPAKIHRTVLPFPLSTDGARYRRLKDDLALYRLTFGQPRQEDLIEILKRRGVQHDPARADELRLRLHPPTNAGVSTREE